MTYGPIDILAVEVKGNNFKGEVLEAIFDLVQREIVRVIDFVVVIKDADGQVQTVEMREMDPETMALFDPLHAEVTSLVSTNDISTVADSLDNNSSAAVLVYENLWAIRVKEALMRLGAKVVLQERIPNEVVEQELEDIASISSANG